MKSPLKSLNLNTLSPLSSSQWHGLTTRLVSVSLLCLLMMGCGKSGFNVMKNNQDALAAGTYMIPPRVDIALFVDDTGSMYQAFPQIQGEVPQFLQKLEQQNWDYRFTLSRLTTVQPILQVVGSQYDGNRTDWVPSYPGASRTSSGALSASVFRSPLNFSLYPNQSWSSTVSGGYEPGLLTIKNTLESESARANFIRPDAMLVVVVLGNGDDTSYLNLCPRADGSLVSCAAPLHPVCTPTPTDPTGGNPNCDSRTTSLDFFREKLKALNPNTKFFSAVSPQSSASCYGSRAYAGFRYMSLASALGGSSYDVCSQNVAQVLDDLTQSLQGERRAFRTKYIMLDQAPEVSTLKITKYGGGNSHHAQVIPQDPIHGWTYAGYLSQVAVIDQPIPMNVQSGYAIELHGSAQLIGEDRASLEWKPQGAQDSVQR